MRINEGAGVGIAIGNLQKKTGTVKIKRKYFVSCRAHARHLNAKRCFTSFSMTGAQLLFFSSLTQGSEGQVRVFVFYSSLRLQKMLLCIVTHLQTIKLFFYKIVKKQVKTGLFVQILLPLHFIWFV